MEAMGGHLAWEAMGGHGRLSGQSLGSMEVTVKGPRRLSVGAISTLYEVMAYGGHGGP